MLNQLMDELICGIAEELSLIRAAGNAFVAGLPE
jgi:hypothetical protein